MDTCAASAYCENGLGADHCEVPKLFCLPEPRVELHSLPEARLGVYVYRGHPATNGMTQPVEKAVGSS